MSLPKRRCYFKLNAKIHLLAHEICFKCYVTPIQNITKFNLTKNIENMHRHGFKIMVTTKHEKPIG